MIDVVIFFAFVIAVITVGVMMSRHEKDSEAYFLAGRGLTWWLIGFSLIAANISAEQFVGMSGQAAKDSIGLAVASYEWVAAITLILVAFLFLPKFLRSGIFTIPEYLEYRFTHSARTIMSLLMVVIFVGVNIATVVYLGAKTLDPFFENLDIFWLSWVVGVGAAIYVVAGGLKACAWADLIQGSALIVGGAVILVLALMALDQPGQYEKIDEAAVYASLGVDEGASLGEKFQVLKEQKMHMVLPSTSDFLPWTALLVGIWIPNLYYWGLNQYIMQRTLGASSLSQGQKGVVFAAGLKLIIPFIVCVPGIIAFTLYGEAMKEDAMADDDLNGERLEEFHRLKANPAAAKKAFPFDGDFAALHPGLAEEILGFNAQVAGVAIPEAAELADVQARAVDHLVANHADFQEKTADEIEALGITDVNGGVVALACGTHRPMWKQLVFRGEYDVEKQKELIGYDYDGAFPLLMRYLTPPGLRGFVLAALMGAVVSSLASMLNAASTIFTMDLFKEYVNKKASQKTLVWVGRSCVPVFVVIGCLIAPQLADPKFKGAFAYIQEFQGYISPGVLTIFLFGLFVPRTPRVSGVVGLVLGPIVYGLLHLFFGDMAFLNRMAITVAVLVVVLAFLTLTRPLKEPVKLPEQSKIAMDSSRGAMLWGIVVVLATVALYVYFY